jgi:TPR repeat protein
VVHENGARGLVETARSRILQRAATRGHSGARGAAGNGGSKHPNARVLTGVVGRIDEHAVRLYEVAAEQGSGYAALRAGDAAFYGGIGTSRIVCLPA